MKITECIADNSERANDCWKVVAVSVAGFSHEKSQIPCQDNFCAITIGNWLIACVSDGAGSAKKSEEGSKQLTNSVLNSIQNYLVDRHEIQLESLKEIVTEAIYKVRDQLGSGESSLRDYDATLVGFLSSSEGYGFSFHIGDGFAAAFNSNDINDCFVSCAENGEYANETYFFTLDDWKDRLRFNSYNKFYDSIVLMTDGCMPFSLSSGGQTLFKPFIKPLGDFLTASDMVTGHAALENTLKSEKIRKITADDKTLVWARVLSTTC